MDLGGTFELHPADGVDPERVPRLTLHTGARIPCIGQGTFGNDRFTPDQIAESVLGGLSVGYRFIDCAAVYGNEPEIGRVLRFAMRNGIARRDLFISSKLWNDRHSPADVLPTLRKSLSDLGLEYLDMYFIHWPFPNTHAPGAAHDSRSPDAKPYIHADYMATYRELEKAVDAGLIRHIGVSNMTKPKMELVLADARVKPAANQMEMHPTFQQTEFFHYLRAHGIVSIAFCPIGSPGRPARDTDPSDVEVLTHPVVKAIAEAHGVHPALVCVKWAVQRGQLPIPSSIHRAKYLSSLTSVLSDPLTPAEMERMAGVDAGSRLIKGQVFLWPGAGSWRDLWDPDGIIAR